MCVFVCDEVCFLTHSVFTLQVPLCAYTEQWTRGIIEGSGLAMFMLLRSFICSHSCWSIGVCICMHLHSVIHSFVCLTIQQTFVECSITCQELC